MNSPKLLFLDFGLSLSFNPEEKFVNFAGEDMRRKDTRRLAEMWMRLSSKKYRWNKEIVWNAHFVALQNYFIYDSSPFLGNYWKRNSIEI